MQDLNDTPGAPRWRDWLRAFQPAAVTVDWRERGRAVAGAFVGILLTGLLGQALLRWLPAGAAWLVAPLGASAVLVFAVPASPLAQPWSVLGGNTVSAVIGLWCALWVPHVPLACALAVALAIGAMFALRCLHPPGGAMALLAVLVHAGHGFFSPGAAALNSLVLVSAGVAYNSLTGRRYPHRQLAPATTAGPPPGVRFESRDLDTVLARYNQVLDVSRDDLEALLQDAELEGHRRRAAGLRCQDVMSRELVTVSFGSSLQEAWTLLKRHGIKALPVTDRSRRIVGIVTLADFIRHADIDQAQGMRASLRKLILPDGLVHSTKPEVVGQIMSRQVRVVSQERHITDLLPLFTEGGHHHIPIIDADKRLVGIITQSDFVRALHQLMA